MIAITNISKKFSETGIQEYSVSINRNPVIVKFKHRRSDGLSTCLLLAAQAVREVENAQGEGDDHK